MKRTLLVLSIIALGAANVFGADLWNQQQAVTTNSVGIINDVFTDNADVSNSSYIANYFTASQNWTINSIDIQVQNPNGIIPNGTQFSATLNLFSATGSLPTAGNNPAAGTAVTVTFTQNGGSGLGSYYDMSISGLNLSAAAGNYWISLTPSSDFNTYGTIFEVYSATNKAGAAFGDAWINPANGFGTGAGWQDAGSVIGNNPIYGGIDIQGTVQSVPEPASMAALCVGLVGLASRRRRKA